MPLRLRMASAKSSASESSVDSFDFTLAKTEGPKDKVIQKLNHSWRDISDGAFSCLTTISRAWLSLPGSQAIKIIAAPYFFSPSSPLRRLLSVRQYPCPWAPLKSLQNPGLISGDRGNRR